MHKSALNSYERGTVGAKSLMVPRDSPLFIIFLLEGRLSILVPLSTKDSVLCPAWFKQGPAVNHGLKEGFTQNYAMCAMLQYRPTSIILSDILTRCIRHGLTI